MQNPVWCLRARPRPEGSLPRSCWPPAPPAFPEDGKKRAAVGSRHPATPRPQDPINGSALRFTLKPTHVRYPKNCLQTLSIRRRANYFPVTHANRPLNKYLCPGRWKPGSQVTLSPFEIQRSQPDRNLVKDSCWTSIQPHLGSATAQRLTPPTGSSRTLPSLPPAGPRSSAVGIRVLV